MSFGGQNEYGKIKRIGLKHPRVAYGSQAIIADQWEKLNYSSEPGFDAALTEYDRFVELIKVVDPEIIFLPEESRTGIDSVYCRDATVVTNKGVILCNMGKPAREGEPKASADFYLSQGIPILGLIEGNGRLEGGDLLYLDERTLAVGCGYRTNNEGIRQLKELTRDLVDEVIVVPLPPYKGAANVFHLMSFISPLDSDLAAVYSPLMPVSFRELLLDRGMSLVEIPEEEFESMACNILAIAPRKVVMLDGNPITENRLKQNGVELRTYRGNEISRKGEGGPTCLTRPLWRE